MTTEEGAESDFTKLLTEASFNDIGVGSLATIAKLTHKLNTGSLTRLVDIRLGEHFLLKKFLIQSFTIKNSKTMTGNAPSYIDVSIVAAPYMIPVEDSVRINEFGQIEYNGFGTFATKPTNSQGPQ